MEEILGIELSVDNLHETFHMHNANEPALMRDGIRFSSMFWISLGGQMEPTISKYEGFRSTLCRMQRICFLDSLYLEEEFPPEFKLFLTVVKRESEQVNWYVC